MRHLRAMRQVLSGLGLLLASTQLAACGRMPQDPACITFVDCVKARDARLSTTTDVTRFEAPGACWNNENLADGCRKACVRGVAWLGSLSGAPKECAP